MAGLKIFISSTCVDLDAYRYQLRGLLERMGYEPVMSDHSEVLYDPELHTHASCIREVEAADIVVLLIGSRFGGAAVPQALPLIDFEQVKKSSTNTGLLSEKNKISITQAEALRAIELNVPVFTFVDSKVYSDHHVYQANRSNPNLATMTFPSIAKPETAKSVFDFISFMSHRSFNNGVIPFNSFSNIEDHLVKQWALLFQRLIHERRDRSAESKKSSDIIERIEDLKAAVLQALPAGTVRDIAKAITKYRGLLDFLYGLKSVGIFDSDFSYGASLVECLRMKGVIDIAWDDDPDSSYYAVLILEDGGFIGCFNVTDDEIVDELATDWEAFRQLSPEIRSAVIDASAEISEGARPFVRSEESFEQYRASLHEERIKQPTSVVTARRRRRVIE